MAAPPGPAMTCRKNSAAAAILRTGAAFSAIVLSLAAGGCAPTSGSEEVRAYIDEIVPFLERGIKTDGPAWDKRHQSTLDSLYEADTIDETYAGLNILAVEAGGPHSSFLSPLQAEDWETASETVQLPEVMAEQGIGIIKLPGFNSSDDALEKKYADVARSGLNDVRSNAACGWIVDLRDNSGGNMFPMLASVAPLLDDGTVLRLKGKSGESHVDIENGRVTRFDQNANLETDVSSFNMPVALLTSSATSSAAEAVVISFLGQEGMRTFGTRTAGFTTGNEVFEISDGAKLILTTGFMVDRNGTSYDGPIEPDVVVNPRSGSDARELAQHWLAEQCNSQ
jgi:carboxyl-terminal processing protease